MSFAFIQGSYMIWEIHYWHHIVTSQTYVYKFYPTKPVFVFRRLGAVGEQLPL